MTQTASFTRAAELNDCLAGEFERVRAVQRDAGASLRGLYIDEAEVQSLLARLSEKTWAELDDERVIELQSWFGLDAFELQVVLACLAPELNQDYERIYAFLQDDIAKKRPTVGLLPRICAGAPDAVSMRAHFHPDAPLARSGLLSLPDLLETPLLDVAPRLDERVVGFLLGSNLLDARLLDLVRHAPEPNPGPLPAAAVDDIAATAAASSRLAALTGGRPGGRGDAARLYARELGYGLLIVDVPSLLRTSAPVELLRLAFREANLLTAAVYLAECEPLWTDAALPVLNALRAELGHWATPCLLGAGADWEAPPTFARRTVARVALPFPTTAEREAAWRRALASYAPGDDQAPEEAHALAASFKLSLDQIDEAVLVARTLTADGACARDHLYAGARTLSSRRLTALGEEIVPKANWSQLVLPDDSTAQLRELCTTVRQHRRVLERAGFGARLSGGTGVTALFSGISGTGKTIGAEVIAGELGLALFRIDLANVVSKWIGETEKNLDRVFEAATDSNAILFFDEADALFGKRSEVKDSHDRYANLEISFLLQKMEAYDGVAILATNMRHQLDDAFLRRLTFNVVFPFPEEADRARIWAAVWPSELEREADVDFARLARIKLVGGNIKNVILAAAHAAAEADRGVTMKDLLHATRREYQKLGKQLSVEELGETVDSAL